MIRLAVILWLCATSAMAQTQAQAAQRAADQLIAAGQKLDAAQSARDRVAALTDTVRAYEDGLAALRTGLRQAATREATIAADLAAKSDRISRLLSVLQTMGQAPAPLLLLHPSGPTGTARSGMMLADVTPALQADAAALRVQLEEVAILRQIQQSTVKTLQDGLTGAQAARAALSTAIANRTDLPRRFTDDPVQTTLLIASTETLDSFASGLTETYLTGAAPTDARAAKGTLRLPVQGTLLRAFNAPDAAGITRPGVILAARPRAMVTTPTAATLLFQGELLDYGNVVILEPAADLLFVIAGMADVLGTAGDVLPAGTPIGLMGGTVAPFNNNLIENEGQAAQVATQTLYLEVRDGQTPVDPAQWFALDDR